MVLVWHRPAYSNYESLHFHYLVASILSALHKLYLKKGFSKDIQQHPKLEECSFEFVGEMAWVCSLRIVVFRPYVIAPLSHRRLAKSKPIAQPAAALKRDWGLPCPQLCSVAWVAPIRMHVQGHWPWQKDVSLRADTILKCWIADIHLQIVGLFLEIASSLDLLIFISIKTGF